jgi:hypothetical protein
MSQMKKTDNIFSEFYNEVLSHGPAAVLPQNLDNKWIQKLQQIVDDFLDSNFNLTECKTARDIGDPILSACVYAILKYQHGDNLDFAPKDMAEKLVIYSLSVTMETVNRKTDFGLTPPTLDNILLMERIIAYQKDHPEFVDLLEQACIIRESDKGWFQNIKERLLSAVA